MAEGSNEGKLEGFGGVKIATTEQNEEGMSVFPTDMQKSYAKGNVFHDKIPCFFHF